MERMGDSSSLSSSSSPSSCHSMTAILKTNFFAVIFFLLLNTQIGSSEYYGKLIGKLSELHHGVSGEVYAVDSRTIFIKDFTYDGEGPAAYFFIGNSRAPIVNGIKIRDEKGALGPLKKYNRKGITLTWPDTKSLNNIRWFSIYCVDYSVNFGDVRIPRGFDYPKPQTIAPLNGVHSVSSEPIVVVDAQTLLISAFSYDGEAPDAKFWVGHGTRPSSDGILIPDENGKITPLRRYNKKTIVLTLPGSLTVHQIGHFGVWCEAFAVDFGHIKIPQSANVPPSLKMLGISPQSKLNCEVLEDSLAFEVRWAVAGDSVVIQLVGKLDVNQYMSFGLSANPNRSLMMGGDVTVAWVDKQTLQGYAVDYILDAKSQCSGARGSCPDSRIQENTDSIRLLNAALVNGYSIVTYQRSLIAADELDLSIIRNTSQAIIWAVGPLNERNEVSFHSHYPKGADKLIEFARPPTWNCPTPDIEDHYDTVAVNDKFNNNSYYDNNTYSNNYNNKNEDNDSSHNAHQILEIAPTTRRPLSRPQSLPAPASIKDPWMIPPIQCDEPDDGVFYAQMGPTGGKHGYPAITGHVGWGISWYINGLLIPEINVVRGKTYTFIIEGGDTPDIPARYHPFYITDDPIGGYEHKTPEEKSKVKIFAGVSRQSGSRTPVPTGVGRFCFWKPDPNHDADDFSSFGAYQRTLTLSCDSSQTLPGNVQWTPDKNTPDTVYYQCYTHRYLGWKINVVDSCDVENDNPQWSSSEQHEIYAKPEYSNGANIENGESIHVPNKKVIPEPNYHIIQADHPYLSPIHHQYHYHHPQQQQYLPPLLHYSKSHHNYLYSHYKKPAKTSASLQLTSANLRDPFKSQISPSASIIKPQQQQRHYNNNHNHNNNNNNNNNSNNNNNNKLNINNAQLYHHAHHHRRAAIPFVHYSHHHHYNNQKRRSQLSASPNGLTENVDEMSQAASTINNPSVYANLQSNFVTDSRPIINIASLKNRNPQLNQQEQQQYLYTVKGGQTMQTNSQMRLMMKNLLSPVVMPPPSINNNKIIHRVIGQQLGSPGIKAKISLSSDSLKSGQIMKNNENIIAARNTGFNPSSIVIEGGFKPIIRQYESHDIYRNLSNQIRSEKLLKPRLNHDMEMVANILDIKRSPFSTSFDASIQDDGEDKNEDDNDNKDNDDDGNYAQRRENVKRSTDIATLITFNGNKVKDLHNLSNAIKTTTRRRKSNDDLHHIDNTTELSSDALTSKVPQFRKFVGELPPHIPSNITNILQLNLQHTRSRRSSSLSSSTFGHNNYENKNVSASQTLLANVHYLILTIVFYFAI